MWIEILLGILTLVALFYVFLKIKWRYWAKKGVYAIEPTFPLGSWPEFFTKTEHLNDTFLRDGYERAKDLPFYGVYFFGSPILVVKDAELAKQILVKDFDSFVDRNGEYMAKMFNTGLRVDKLFMEQMTNARGETWKNLRTTFTPIFTSGKMKAMMIFMQETCKRLIDDIDGYAKTGESFELKKPAGNFSMDTIASCAFGVDSQAFTNKDSKFVQYASSIFQQTVKDGLKIMFPFLVPNGAKIMGALNISVGKATEMNFFYDVIMSSLEHRRETKTRRNDLIDLMMDAIKGDIEHDKLGEDEQFEKDAKLKYESKKFEHEEIIIVATALIILVAGYDTTGTTLAFVCYQLAKNPDIQNRLREEVQEITNDSDRDITYDDLNKMTYMDQVISETLRFHSPIGVLQRTATKDYKMPGHDLVISKEGGVWINAVAIHMDPKHYANPRTFDPEHFSKEAKLARNPYAYLPFGQGPRGCLGMRFAIMEAKLALANVVRNFNLIPSEKTQEPLQLDPTTGIAYVKGGLFIKAEKL